MASSIVYLKGTTGYVKLDKPDDYDKYVVQLALDKASKKLVKESGMRNDIKDGDVIYLRRPVSTQFMDGTIKEYGPPSVIDLDGNEVPVSEYSRAWTGALVTCKLTVYDSSRGKGSRLETVRIEKDSELAGQAPEVFGDVDVPF